MEWEWWNTSKERRDFTLGFCREESSRAQFGKPIILEHFRRKDNAIFILFCFYLFIWHSKHSMKITRSSKCDE